MSDFENYDYKYYDYVMKIQSIIFVIFNIYINQFAFWAVRGYYSVKGSGTTLTVLTIIAVVLLIIFRKQMDNIKKNSWIIYNIVIIFVAIIFFMTIRTVVTSGIITSIDLECLKGFLKELMTEHTTSVVTLRYVRTLICLGLTSIMFIYCIVSVIMNFVSFSKRRDFFAN